MLISFSYFNSLPVGFCIAGQGAFLGPTAPGKEAKLEWDKAKLIIQLKNTISDAVKSVRHHHLPVGGSL